MNSRLRESVALAVPALLCAAALLSAETIPAGTEIQVRLKTEVKSTSKEGEKVEAVVVVPAVSDGRIVLPSGTVLTGSIKAASPFKEPDQRAAVALEFSEVAAPGGARAPVKVKLLEVDNARESVDEEGQILGILESETLTARMDRGLEKLSGRFARFAELLQVAKDTVFQKADAEIAYDPGVELKLALAEPVELKSEFPAPQLGPITPFEKLYALVNALPFQTTAEKPPKPSDLTNLLFIGTREQVEKAFAEAGWATAEQLNARSGLETFRAVVENRGYSEAPMSTLLLDGRKPAMVFQKQLNTFAKRHHLRIFARPERFNGRELWACAATHDIGISFSPENKTFIHDIDGRIDGERAKVVADLVFTGLVKGVALVERPEVPTQSENATGDKIETDGRMAVLLLDSAAPLP